MKKTKLIAIVCTFLSGISSFTYGMQGESSSKDEKKLENNASIEDDKLNQRCQKLEDCYASLMQMINSGINNPNLKRYGKKTLKYGGGTLGTWGFLKYVGNSILFPGSHPIAKRFGAASRGSDDINIRVPLEYNLEEYYTPGVKKKLSYYTLSGSLTYNDITFQYNQYNWADIGGNFEYWHSEKSVPESVYNNEDLKHKLKDCKGIVICFGGNGDNAIGAKPIDVQNKLVLALDLPGYGFSEQKWKNDKILQNYAYQCLKCAINFSKILTGKDNLPVTVSGWSLGGYAATYLTQFEEVKKCILYAPVVLSKVNPFVRLVRPIVFGYDLDSIENLKNSNENCKIFLTSGTLKKGDFLSLESTVLGKSVQEVTKQQPDEQGDFQNDALAATAKAVRKAILDSRSEEQKAKGLENRLFVKLINGHHCDNILSDKEDEFVKPNEN